jgi:hypothetical protein
MAAGIFSITELRSVAGSLSVPLGGERFEWSADSTAPSSIGGARATPLGPWALPLSQAYVRTDYAGARRASLQVLGPRRKPFTLRGKWDDRWNFPGYAVAEFRRFEQMVSRGNVVRIQFQGQVIDGLIADLEPDYYGDWRVDYSFTVEPIERPGETDSNRSPPGPLTPAQCFDDAAIAVAALEDSASLMPAADLTGDIGGETMSVLATIIEARDSLGATLDQRDLLPNALPVASLPRLATQFRQLGDSSQVLLDIMADMRADLDLTTQSAASVIRYEQWTRGMRVNARLLRGQAAKGADDMDERASPQAERLYRPFEGEHLYQISRKHYGTPHAWRLISSRNNLRYVSMTGNELLIIPDRGPG